MPWFSSASLRTRLIVLMVLAGIPALGIVLYSGLQQRREAAEEARREAMSLARSVAADQQRLVVEARQLLSLLATLDPIRGGDPDSCSAFLGTLLAQDERFVNFGVSRPDGEVVCSAIPLAGATNLSDRSYYRRAVATRDFAVGDYQVGRITGVAGLNFGYPIVDSRQQVQGVVYAALPLSWLRARIAEAQLPEGSAVTVIDPSFTVLARYPEGDWVGKNIRETPLATAIRETGGEGAVERPDLDGVERLYAAAPLQDRPGAEQAFVVVGIPSDMAFAAVDRALARVLGTLILLGLVTLAATWWGGDVFVVRPVRKLLAATRRLAAGELSARAPVAEDRGEVAELGRSFNVMAAAIEAHLERIARLNRVYAVLSGINSAILRIRSEEELLRDVCRIAVELGQLRLATVHRVAPDGQTELAAWSDSAPPGVEMPPPAARRRDGGGLVGAVLGTSEPVVARDPETDPRLAGWWEVVRSAGYRSAAAFPLRVDDATVAVLTLFAGEPDFFDDEELRLLRELTADTSLGLQNLENERRLDYLTNYDTLTRLPNRNLSRDRLQQAVAAAKQNGHVVGVLAVRINRIAEINATFGHHAGDAILREIAHHLTAAVREGDTVARLGSGEFGVILAGLPGSEQVAPLANEILVQAPQQVSVDGEDIFVSLSIGVAIYPLDGEDVSLLVQNATLARQAAASEAMNTLTFFAAELNAQAQEKRRIEYALRRALDQDELALFYQPVVDVQSRRIIGVESLLRWESAELGFVSPSKFIPVAEETGLIRQIGEWIVAVACAQGQQWHARGFDVRINVNVSVGQLRDEGFVERVSQILRESEFDPRLLSLGLEITESELMENAEAVLPAIRHFKAMGLVVYIDDFGTGYSSLSYLRQLPIDTLKIDISFIRDIPGDANAVAVVAAIIAMARSLELRVIAEGVETEEQFALLRELGCDAVQGFLLGRPGRPEEVEVLFDRTL